MGLEAIVMQAMAQDPDERFSAVAQLAYELSPYAQWMPPAPTTRAPPIAVARTMVFGDAADTEPDAPLDEAATEEDAKPTMEEDRGGGRSELSELVCATARSLNIALSPGTS